MKIRVEVDTDTLKRLAIAHIRESFEAPIDESDIVIEVRSRQNYRQRDWEKGEFRAVLEKSL